MLDVRRRQRRRAADMTPWAFIGGLLVVAFVLFFISTHFKD
jgi:type VI protein secretion system component VasF